MSIITPSNVVMVDGQSWIVVDVTGDGAVILRRPGDMFGQELISKEVKDL